LPVCRQIADAAQPGEFLVQAGVFRGQAAEAVVPPEAAWTCSISGMSCSSRSRRADFGRFLRA
jgi:hypothetical protein